MGGGRCAARSSSSSSSPQQQHGSLGCPPLRRPLVAAEPHARKWRIVGDGSISEGHYGCLSGPSLALPHTNTTTNNKNNPRTCGQPAPGDLHPFVRATQPRGVAADAGDARGPGRACTQLLPHPAHVPQLQRVVGLPRARLTMRAGAVAVQDSRARQRGHQNESETAAWKHHAGCRHGGRTHGAGDARRKQSSGRRRTRARGGAGAGRRRPTARLV